MITRSEARMIAAGAVLAARIEFKAKTAEDAELIADELHKIEKWLRREALGNDKIAIRQLEKELGHQVRMRGKP